MDDNQSYVIDNLINEFREDEMYKEAIVLFPELVNYSREEVLVQIKSIIKNRKERKEAKNNNDVDMPTRKIFIDNVICNDTKFTDEEVRDHVYTIVAAGSETTALQTAHTSRTTKNFALKYILFTLFYCFCLVMLLATHPEIQDRVYEELKEVFYSDDIEIDLESISKLPYLERVIKESLRLCPVVPVIGRETQAPVQIGEIKF